MDESTKLRYLERLFDVDPTEVEVWLMWNDRPRLERLLALKEGKEYKSTDPHPMQWYDFELWRAKMRSELNVRRQGFWFQRLRKLGEYLAHLVDSIMRRSCGVASAERRVFCV